MTTAGVKNSPPERAYLFGSHRKGSADIEHNTARHRGNGSGPDDQSGLISLTGCTPDGKPLAYSRAPSPDIAPWVHSLAVADIIAHKGSGQSCAFFLENAAIRLLLKGKWRLETADGVRTYDANKRSHTLYFGPQTRIMPLSVEGHFTFIQMQFHPGGHGSHSHLAAPATLDRIVEFDKNVPQSNRGKFFRPDESRDLWLDAFEGVARKVLAALADGQPSSLVLDFERRLLTDHELDLDAFAAEHDISRRTLERTVHMAFGISPAAVLRRARVLDMAAALLGVAMPDEEADFRLRFFDQAHMTREIRKYFGMSPGMLAGCEAYLLRIDLEIRQMRRVAAMQELGIDEVPWRSADGLTYDI